MKKFTLTEKAKLQCNCGYSLSELKVTSQSGIRTSNLLDATEADNQYGINIFSFGICSHTQKACIPNPLQWEETESWDTIAGKATLTNLSRLPCSLGGIISCKENTQFFYGIREMEENPSTNFVKSKDSEKKKPKAYLLLRDGTLREDDLPVSEVDRIYNMEETEYIDLEKAEQIESTWEELDALVYAEDVSENNKTRIPGTFYCFRMKTKVQATEVFEFLAMNSDVEFSYTQLDHLFVIGTCKHRTTVDSSKKITLGMVKDARIAEFIHSHPVVQGLLNERTTPDTPSGFNTKSGIPTIQGGDRNDAETKLRYNPKCKFAVLSCLYSQRENKKVYIQYTDRKFDYTRAKKYYDAKGEETYYEY